MNEKDASTLWDKATRKTKMKENDGTSLQGSLQKLKFIWSMKCRSVAIIMLLQASRVRGDLFYKTYVYARNLNGFFEADRSTV